MLEGIICVVAVVSIIGVIAWTLEKGNRQERERLELRRSGPDRLPDHVDRLEWLANNLSGISVTYYGDKPAISTDPYDVKRDLLELIREVRKHRGEETP